MSERRPYVPTAKALERQARNVVMEERIAALPPGYGGTRAPVPGLYAWRAIKGGPEIAARIRHEPTRDPVTGEPLDRSWYWSADIDGATDLSPGVTPSDNCWNISIFGRPIDEAEYRYLVANSEWARQHAPATPEADPWSSVDLNTAPVPF